MPALSEVVVHGLADLDRAFAYAGKSFQKELRSDLRKIAEPVRVDAERRAVAEIRNIHDGDPWSLMRTVAKRTVVYVAPVQRGRNSRRNPGLLRPNLAPLMMDRAMQPALDAHTEDVVREFEHLLDNLGSTWERV